MTNLVYATPPKTDGSFAEEMRKIWEPQAREYMGRLDTLVASQLALAERDGVAPEFAGEHARDMGLGYPNPILGSAIDFPIHESFKVGTLNVYHDARTQIWTFTDDRGVTISMTEEVVRRLPTAGIMHKDPLRMGLLVIRPGPDKLRRNFIVEDDRGCRYPVEVMRPVHVINCPIPNRDIFPISGSITKSTDNKEARMGTATKSTTKETTKSATEKPIAQQPVKLGVYFRVNGLPQELSQRQANEHVAKLLTLGAATVRVERFIRDETSERFAHQY